MAKLEPGRLMIVVARASLIELISVIVPRA